MTKLELSIAVLLVAAASGVASAQPNILTPDPENPQPLPQAPQPPQPPGQVPQPQPQPQPQPRTSFDSRLERGVAEDPRPTELAFGVGVGYVFPTSLETPNVTSIRIRLQSGVVIEPRLSLSVTTQTANSTGTDVSTQITDLGVGALLRYPLAHRGRFELELVGLANVDSTTTNPDGDNNNSTITTFTLDWGLGVEYWLSRHWAVSVTATNPLVSYSQTETDAMPTNQTQTAKSYGLIIDPTVVAMIHLYN